MKTYLICSRDAGVLGLYEAASEAAAHDVLARDAGYRDCAHEAEVLSKSVEYLRADLTITEVNLAATVKEIAEAMVVLDRESGDLEPEVLDDPAACDASHWDLSAFGVAVEDVGVDDALATAIARDTTHLVQDAYAKAWRAAVELDLAATVKEIEVDVPAAITALAHEMVRCYRVCGDDLFAVDMLDDNAHHADDWDHVGVAACGVAAGLRPDLVEALWQQYRDDLRDAYVAAWRAAVEADLVAAVTEIAASMVVLDRDSSDCDAVRDDADAGDAEHWDTDGVVAAAEATGIDGALAAHIARDYMPFVRHAYAKAWRAAVEADLAARDDDAA